jgi:hypothetical protein
MPKRKLLIVRKDGDTALLGICEYCNMQFAATLIQLGEVEQTSVQEQFDAHKCKREDFSQAAVRTVREATENK